MAKKGRLRVAERRERFRGRVFTLTSDTIVEPSGIRATRDILWHPGSVVVLAVDDNGKDPRILLERQYRYAAGQELWELPAGHIEPGEAASKAARRELLEETGYRARSWKRILYFFPTPGCTNETMTVFLACGLTPGPAQLEDDEAIETHFVPLSRAVRMATDGTICDGKTIMSILWLKAARGKRSAARRGRHA